MNYFKQHSQNPMRIEYEWEGGGGKKVPFKRKTHVEEVGVENAMARVSI